MGRLQSGLLLFETPKGLVRIELSFKERAALLWTFRNFRRLSPRLLNSRENTLIHTLYRTHAGVLSHSYDPALVIGVVEDFVPSMEMAAPEIVSEKIVSEKSVAQMSVAQRTISREVVAQESAQKVIAEKIAAPASAKKERKRKQAAEHTESAPNSRPVSSSPRVNWSTVMSRLATAIGALSLCIVSVVAWHRIEAVPGSQAQSRPELEQVSSIALASAPIAEPVTVAAARPAPAAELVADPDAPLKPTRIFAGIPAAPAPAVAPPAVAISAVAAPAAPASTVAMSSKQTTRVHTAVSTRTLPLSVQDSEIQATRPPLRYVYPDYSDIQARGVVALTAELDSEGKVRSVKVITGNRALAAAAIRAVRQWRYRPYMKDGQPVATETNILISFISSDAISMTFPPSITAMR